MKHAFDLARVVIMGNGGAGKSWLADRLGKILGSPVFHLDDFHWEPGNKGVPRDRAERDRNVAGLKHAPTWVMEGVYGQLVDLVLDRVSTLIWIDLADQECIANVRSRGAKPGESLEQFEGFVTWVSEYRTRTKNWNSFETHQRLYDGFAGDKRTLRSREDIALLLQSTVS